MRHEGASSGVSASHFVSHPSSYGSFHRLTPCLPPRGGNRPGAHPLRVWPLRYAPLPPAGRMERVAIMSEPREGGGYRRQQRPRDRRRSSSLHAVSFPTDPFRLITRRRPGSTAEGRPEGNGTGPSRGASVTAWTTDVRSEWRTVGSDGARGRGWWRERSVRSLFARSSPSFPFTIVPPARLSTLSRSASDRYATCLRRVRSEERTGGYGGEWRTEGRADAINLIVVFFSSFMIASFVHPS